MLFDGGGRREEGDTGFRARCLSLESTLPKRQLFGILLFCTSHWRKGS
jgi:hypothetical protein